MKQGICIRKLVEKANNIKFNYISKNGTTEVYHAYYKDIKIVKYVDAQAFEEEEDLQENSYIWFGCPELKQKTNYIEKLLFLIDCEE